METKSWPQTWANYYSHLTQNMSMEETNDAMEEERAIRRAEIKRAKEHLQGVALFYEQSAYVDPNPPGEVKKGSVSLSDDDSGTNAKESASDRAKRTRELSDKEI
jgi:hypothetical protein